MQQGLSDDQFYRLCAGDRKLQIERSAAGEVTVMPPAGGETGFRNSDLALQLGWWTKRDKRGRAFDSNTQFILPDGAAFAPDAAWVSRAQLDRLTKDEKRHFLKVVPEFVVELKSPTDRLPALKQKMTEWIANGVELGWLIDADRRTVYVYRPGRDCETLTGGVSAVAGEGPVAGFVLDLQDIWEGL